MRYQTGITLKDGSLINKVVRANCINDAISRMISSEDKSFAPYGYAHPLTQPKPKPEDYRWRIRCSVTGEVTMLNTKPPTSNRGHQ